ncbi:MAG: ABC transporter permease [Candidatus Omnitrophota bacterium]|jgi:ABC-2 type transport system permease protein
MLERILAILHKEFLQVFRDPRMKMVIFVSPVVQLLIFGYAATMDITNIPTAVFDRDNTRQSRDITRLFSYSKYFDIERYLTTEKQQSDVINKTQVYGVIKFDRGFARDVTGNKPGEMQLVLDGTDSNAAQIIMGYANQIMNDYNYSALQDRAVIMTGNDAAFSKVDLRERRWFNENLESKNYYLPGVIALIVSIMALLLSSMAIVREKEIGTMEQLIVSPIKPIELILGKLTPFAIIACTQVVLITAIGVLWFHVPIRGSMILLFSATLIYLMTALGIGLFISTVSATQQEAMMSVFLFYFPATLLSGFAYPIANMPQVIQWITYLNPMRYYLVILRYIFLKGVGVTILWDEILSLAVMGVCIITLSSMRFQKNLG